MVEGIAKTGKPVVGFGIEGHGDIAIVAKASYQAKRFVQWATELQREECPIADLWVSTQYYSVETAGGVSQDHIILVSYAATQAEADTKLRMGDYAFMA